jgi:TRAP transporter TAXI family solute receptor
VQIAFIQNDIAYYAVNGEEMFVDNKIEGLQCLATLYPETCQVITLEKSGIKTIADLKGKKVAVGAAGSGVEANARQILAAYGITYDDIKVQYLSFAEAANSLKDGNIDAGFITAGHPTAAIQDIASQHQVKLLSIDDSVADKLIADYPFYTKVTIPVDTYPNQAEEVNTIGVKAMLVINDKMSDETAYSYTKAIFDNLDQLKAAHAVGSFISKENAKAGISIPMSAGSEKYFSGN